MANTLAGVNLDRIASLTLDTLVPTAIPLSAFTTDFSDDVKPHGESVTTRFATAPTTQDFASNRTAQNAVTTARKITLNNYRGVPLEFTDLERTYTDQDLIDLFIGPSISALVDYMIAEALGLVTNANFAAKLTSTAGDFDSDDVADLAEALDTAKVPAAPRTLLIKPTYKSSLVKDGAIHDTSSYGSSEPIRENRIPRLHGFNVISYNGTIPGNSENLVGIATHAQAIIIAARGVAHPPSGTWFGNIRDVIEPKSGLTIQIREYYDNTNLRYEFSVLFGVQLGVTGNLKRIVSA